MVCPYCGSSNIITIKGQGFCVNCGRATPKPGQTEVAAKASLPNITTISHFGTAKVEATPEPTKTPEPPRPAPTPQSAPKMNDLVPRRSTVDVRPPAPRPVPAPSPDSKIRPKVTPEVPHHGPDHIPRAPSFKKHPVNHKTPKRRRNQAQGRKLQGIVAASNIASGVLAGLAVAKAYLIVHVSDTATPGEFFHYLATRSHNTKLMLAYLSPVAVIATAAILIGWLWLRASAIYATSRLYDQRPTTAKAARHVGASAIGSLSLLSLIALILAIAWTVGLVAAIKGITYIGSTNWQAVAGVTVSFVMVLIGLWLASIIVMAGYITILSGQKTLKSLVQSTKLSTKNFAYTCGTALWLTLWAIAVLGLGVASFGLMVGRHWPVWLITTLGAILVAAGIGWLSDYSLRHWLRRYRVDVLSTFGPDKAALYLAGRTNKPISTLGIVLSCVWWVVVAIGASVLIWHLKVDPTNLLNKLSVTIY